MVQIQPDDIAGYVKRYSPTFKQKIVRLRLEKGRTFSSLRDEYGVGQATIDKWCKQYQKGILEEHSMPQKAIVEPDHPTKDSDKKALEKRVAELEKEVDFLRQAAAYFAKAK